MNSPSSIGALRERVEVHIGGGITTIPHQPQQVLEDTSYLLVDPLYEDRHAAYVQSLTGAFRAAHKDVLFLHDRAQHLSLPDSMADRVCIFNVLNSDDACYENEARMYIPGSLPFEDAVLGEAQRILKPDGSIYIGANNTPYDYSLDDVVELAGRLCLSHRVLFHMSPDRQSPLSFDEAREYAELSFAWHVEPWRFPTHSYLVELRKEVEGLR